MKTFWSALVLFCALGNGIIDASRWYLGLPPSGATWLFAIFFIIGVATDCILDLARYAAAKPKRHLQP